MKIKKILSLLVVLTLVCSFMTITNVQAAEDEFGILTTLGINPDFGDDATPITRYQLANIAMDIAGLSLEPEGEPIYPDIPLKHKYFPLINAVTLNGLMGALADGSFSPNSNATAMDGGRVLLAVLGYTAFAVQAGWTDAQYNSKVQSLGLLSGVDSSEGLTAYVIKKMMVNMLTKNVMEIVSVDAEGIKFKESDLTYIEYKYGYKLKIGVLQANSYSSSAGHLPVTAKQAVIDGVLYKTDGRDYTDYVGYNVKFILTSEYDDGRIIHIEKYKGSEELVIDADKIVEYNDYTYTYIDENGSTETVSFPTTARVIINDQNMGTYDARHFKPDLGSVTLVDTDGDYNYDLVNISSKIYVKIGSTTTSGISNAWSGEAYDFGGKTSSFYNDGKNVELIKIEPNSYIELSAGAITHETVNGNVIIKPDISNSKIITVNVVNGTTTVTGRITTRRVDAIGIDGVLYEMNAYYYDLVKSDYVDAVALGATATLVLNSKGEIIDVVDVTSEYANSDVAKNYGYMTAISAARGGTDQGVVRIIDLTTLEEERYVTDEECKINGKKFKYSEAIVYNNSNTCFYLPDGNFKHQLIRYALNEEGEISELYLAVDRAHEKLTKHIMPLTHTDILPENTIDYYVGTSPEFIDNPDYDSKYDGYDNNNFTLDKNGYLAARTVIDGLYTLDKTTIQIVIPVDKAIDGSGVALGNNELAHYDAYTNVQDPRYWQVCYGDDFNASDNSLIMQTITAKSSWNYLALYDVSEDYVPAVAIKYVKNLPVVGDLPIEGPAIDAAYSTGSRFWYVTDINTIYDEISQQEKHEVTAVAADSYRKEGLITQKFITATKLKESSLYHARIVSGYDYETDMATYVDGSTTDLCDDKQTRTAKTWEEIKKGDMIEVRLNTAGEVNSFRIVCDGDIIKDADNLKCGNVYRHSWTDEMGYVAVNLGYCLKSYGKDGALLNLGGLNGPTSGLRMIGSFDYKPGGANSIKGSAMIIHTKSGQCEPAKLDDIEIGDYVLYRRNVGVVVEVFIIRP